MIIITTTVRRWGDTSSEQKLLPSVADATAAVLSRVLINIIILASCLVDATTTRIYIHEAYVCTTIVYQVPDDSRDADIRNIQPPSPRVISIVAIARTYHTRVYENKL